MLYAPRSGVVYTLSISPSSPPVPLPACRTWCTTCSISNLRAPRPLHPRGDAHSPPFTPFLPPHGRVCRVVSQENPSCQRPTAPACRTAAAQARTVRKYTIPFRFCQALFLATPRELLEGVVHCRRERGDAENEYGVREFHLSPRLLVATDRTRTKHGQKTQSVHSLGAYPAASVFHLCSSVAANRVVSNLLRRHGGRRQSK